MQLATLVQARMSSRRLPGKTLLLLAGKPLLQHVIERLQANSATRRFTIVTSTDPSDQPIVDFCRRLGVDCRRGSLNDVAHRFVEIATAMQLDAFARISGDSPFIDTALIAQALDLYRHHRPELVTNVPGRTFPNGQSVEVLDLPAFAEAYRHFEIPDDFEHVTPYFYRHLERFRTRVIRNDLPGCTGRQVVDTPDDFAHAEALFALMDRPPLSYTWHDVQLLNERLDAMPAARPETP